MLNSILMKIINLAYKFKLMPESTQLEIFSSWAGTCRFLYNLGLEHRVLLWGNQYPNNNLPTLGIDRGITETLVLSSKVGESL